MPKTRPLRYGARAVGRVVAISVSATHHNPAVWPDPYHFEPYRFDPYRFDRREAAGEVSRTDRV